MKTTTDREPSDVELDEPGFDELPGWFQEEIRDANTRRQVNMDRLRTAATARHGRFAVFGAALFAAAIFLAGSPGIFGLLLFAGCGAGYGALLSRSEWGHATAVLVGGTVSVPVLLLVSFAQGSAIAILSGFSSALILLVGIALLARAIESERNENLPF